MSSTDCTVMSEYFAGKGITDAQAFCSDVDSSPAELAAAAQCLISIGEPSKDDPVGQALAMNPSLPPREMVALTRFYADHVAQNLSLPVHLATRFDLLLSQDTLFVPLLVRSKYLRPSILRALVASASDHPQERAFIALLCPGDLAHRFVDDLPSVRRLLANNWRISLATQRQLACDMSPKVRAGLAGNSGIKSSVIDLLLQPNECAAVLRELVRNPNTSIEQLQRLKAVENDEISSSAKERLARPEDVKAKQERNRCRLARARRSDDRQA